MPGWREQPNADKSPPREDDPAADPPLTQGLQDYLCARAELLVLETQEATLVAKQKGGLAVALIIAVVFGYSLILIAMVGLGGSALGAILPSGLAPFAWELSALLFGGLHLFAAYLVRAKLLLKSSTPLYEVTRSEFEKDRQWIHNQQIKRENDS